MRNLLKGGGSSNGMKRILAALLIFSLPLASVGCAKKTTLDRIGAVIITAVDAYGIELDQLKAGNNLSEEKYNKLKGQATLASQRAREFATKLSAFGTITPGNVSQITTLVSDTTVFVQTLLRDAGLAPSSKAVRILDFAVSTLNAASIVLAGIHPGPVVTAQRDTGIGRPNPTAQQIVIQLPPTQKDVEAALRAAAK